MISAKQFNSLLWKFFSTTLKSSVVRYLRAKKIYFEQDLHIVTGFCGQPVDYGCNFVVKSCYIMFFFTISAM